MESEELITGTRVKAINLLHNIDNLKALLSEENITPRREGAIGIIIKQVPGIIFGSVVLVQHVDDDGFGGFNGEVAAYYACELQRTY